MTIRETKIRAIKKLKTASGREAAIDVEILLAHALGISREELLTHDERYVPPFALRRFDSFVKRRAKHEPIAYIVGHKEFFGLQFAVNKHTLIPRPETELIVEEALRIITPPTPSYLKRGRRDIPPLRVKGRKEGLRAFVIDVGTGSGAIAVAIAKNLPAGRQARGAAIIATDISKQALKIAERNAMINGIADRIVFRHSDLVAVLSRPAHFDNIIITANLPYLPTKVWQKCAPDVKKYEPKTALVGGKDGLKYYDKLFHQVTAIFPAFEGRRDARRERVRPLTSQPSRNASGSAGTTIICEIDPSQKTSFPKLAKRHFPNAKIVIKNDLAGRPRVALITNVL